jgi:hypothetical protein
LVWGLVSFVFPIKLFLFSCEVKERKEMTEKYPISVDEVRDAQDSLRTGITEHEAKNFKEAIAAFKKSTMIHPFDENHLSELETKLKGGNFKLQQESIAYMGCAAVHLNEMIHGLSEDEKQEVPIDDSLMNAFKDW